MTTGFTASYTQRLLGFYKGAEVDLLDADLNVVVTVPMVSDNHTKAWENRGKSSPRICHMRSLATGAIVDIGYSQTVYPYMTFTGIIELS